MEWSIRRLLDPVTTRSINYGVSPFDVEYVLQQMEKKPVSNGRALEQTWNEEWTKKANRYSTYGRAAKEQGNLQSASEFYRMTAGCYLACYLINSRQIAGKREVYKKLERYYQAALGCSTVRYEKVTIPMMEKKVMPGYLYFPQEGKAQAPYPCVTIMAGIGSSKEELETLAEPLLARGVAVLVLDQPGTGSALFDYDLKLSAKALEEGFVHTMEFLQSHPAIDENWLGAYGVGMGGGYAYRMAAKYSEIKSCASLFPVVITALEQERIPRWMRDGVWAQYQREEKEEETFLEEMKVLEEGTVSGSCLIVRSNYDNWMSSIQMQQMLDKVSGRKEEIVISEALVCGCEESILHTIPGSEQMNWIKIKVADWLVTRLNEELEEKEEGR